MRMRRELGLIALVTAIAFGGATAGGATAGGATAAVATGASEPQATIEVEANQANGTVASSALGSTFLNPFAGMGSFDAATNSYYPSFLRDLHTSAYVGSLRFPGGITADFYDWERAIGPQSQRTDNPYGPLNGPSPSTVGSDEFGELLDDTGASGVITTNFSTGSAQEAADWVAYMTGRVGSSRWADLRARNGHPQPYNVPMWEVGNEEQSAANSWRAGTPVSVGGPSTCVGTADCEYIYGGTTSFTKQPVVGYADRSSSAADSTGAAYQSFYVAFPPVSPGSQTIFVGGQQWTEVSSLADAAATDDVYTIDDATGRITFGDGVHGAIPASGAQITASYESGPHDGFVDFYKAMKQANPNIKVCSTDTDSDFIEDAGSSVPYDCLQYHPYVGITDTTGDITDFEQTVMAQPESEVSTLDSWESEIQADAGHSIPLELSEYGSLIGDTPDPALYPYYFYSLDEALLNASQLVDWIKAGVTVADRQLLAAEEPAPTAVTNGLPQASPFATTGAIVTPGPDTVVEPTARYFRLFAPLGGGALLGTDTFNNPGLTTTGGSASDLSVIAARRGGVIDTIVINRDPSNPVSTTLDFDGVRTTGPATLKTLNGPDALSFNTTAAPDTVTTTTSRATVSDDTLPLTFPAHSITLVRVAQAAGSTVTGPAVALAAQSPIVYPGSGATVTATISNPTTRSLAGTASLILPSGWSGQPASAQYSLQPGASTTVSFDVSSPASATAGDYDLGLTATADGLTATVATLSLIVDETLAASFDNIGITDDSDVTPGEFDGVGNSFSAEALAAGGIVPGGTFTAGGLTFTWPDLPPATDDNTVTAGQTIAVSGSGTELGIVGATSTGPLSGTGTIHYTDGTTSTFTLSLGNYFGSTGGPGNVVVLTMPYVNDSNPASNGGSVQRKQTVSIYEQSVPITAGKTVQAVTLPDQDSGGTGSTGRVSAQHVFAITVGTPST